MLNEIVRRELFGDSRVRQTQDTEGGRKPVQISGRQVAVVLLMMMILGSWALDSFHINFVPRPVHDSIASMIDTGRESNANSRWWPSVDGIVAHNPLDDSPITFGSVVLLGLVCAVGLGTMAFSMTEKKPE
jgi:hypothetical protein